MDVLEWIGIVIAAGFVGYFGRYAAKLLIARLEKKPPESPPTASTPPPDADTAAEKARLKLEKKRAKQAAKQAKKSGDS